MRATQLVSSADKMAEGDLVEFQSDLQTDKGPATGVVLVRDGNRVAIKYSGDVEWFDIKELRVLEFIVKPGTRLWMLE